MPLSSLRIHLSHFLFNFELIRAQICTYVISLNALKSMHYFVCLMHIYIKICGSIRRHYFGICGSAQWKWFHWNFMWFCSQKVNSKNIGKQSGIQTDMQKYTFSFGQIIGLHWPEERKNIRRYATITDMVKLNPVGKFLLNVLLRKCPLKLRIHVIQMIKHGQMVLMKLQSATAYCIHMPVPTAHLYYATSYLLHVVNNRADNCYICRRS